MAESPLIIKSKAFALEIIQACKELIFPRLLFAE